jgi:hypothetical protein
MVHIRLWTTAVGRGWSKAGTYLPFAVGLLWVIASIVLPSPTRASSVLLNDIDPAAVGYLGIECGFLLVLRGVYWVRGRA